MAENPDNCIHCGTTLTLTDGEERVCEKCGRVFVFRDDTLTLVQLPADTSDYGSVPTPTSKRGRKAAAE